MSNLSKELNIAPLTLIGDQSRRIMLDWIFWATISIVAIATLIPRLGERDHLPEIYLRVEDGNVFINDANSMGILSIIEPYAGYLHIYPRIIAYLASSFDLISQPIFLFCGWLLAYLLMMYSVVSAARTYSLSLLSSICVVALISLQPNYGTNFFNITNSQWLVGAALVLLVLVNSEETKQSTFIKTTLLVPMGLTGPFSIVLAPVLLLKLALLKDWKENSLSYLILFLCAGIQSVVLISSGRAAPELIDVDPWNWVIPFFQILLFDVKSVRGYSVVIVFWGVVFFSIFAHGSQSEAFSRRRVDLFLLLVSALLLVIASEYSHKSNPPAVVALGGGNRYSWIPFVIFIFVGLVATQRIKVLHLIAIVLLTLLSVGSFHRVMAPNLQFESFAAFAARKDVIIPISPQLPAFPGWHISVPPRGDRELRTTSILDTHQSNIKVRGGATQMAGLVLKVYSEGTDPVVLFKQMISCENRSHVGLEIDVSRHSEGWMQLFWDENGQFHEIDSLKRWYPSGLVTAQFAFPISEKGLFVRFDPLEAPGEIDVKQVRIYCV